MNKDYIFREDALNAISKGNGCGNTCSNSINKIPAKDVAPVIYAHWEITQAAFSDGQVSLGNFYCSNCKDEPLLKHNEDTDEVIFPRYCSNCGAIMATCRDDLKKESEGTGL